MSLSAKYQRFLASPSADALADNASLNYITTLTTIRDAPAILKHLAAQAKQLTQKSEKILGAVESGNGLCLDVETTIEFLSGGGAFLPGLDDNFLTDRVVHFPSIHIVSFDENQKISQIRLYWEQGSLLKQLDVIGARARNWPIRDGKDMIRLISSSVAVAGKDEPAAPAVAPAPEPEQPTKSGRPSISSKRSSVSATGDPHASLSLFEAQGSRTPEQAFAKTISPRQSAKPAYRGLTDILATDDDDSLATPSSVLTERIPVKSGGGKNYLPSRLFDEDNEATPTPSPEKTVKTNPKKYNHFEFGEGEEAPAMRGQPTDRGKKHMSQWDFEDFVTPQKAAGKVRDQDVRHFGWSDDEADADSPVRRPVVHQPRPDSKHHFEFADDGAPADKREAPSKKGALQNKGMGLYKDHILGDESEDTPTTKKPLANVTSHVINNENRRKDFGANWEMRDTSSPTTDHPPVERKIPEDRKKVLSGLDVHWSLFDEGPVQQSKKENMPGSRGIRTSGNGMGGRKDAAATWDFGDDGEREAPAPRGRAQKQSDKNFWDF